METKKKILLVVEDDSDILAALVLRFETNGYRVIAAEDGEDGLKKARTERPDLIILDLMLPRLRGEEICKAIREDLHDKTFAALPIIILSAKDLEVDRIIGKVIGANVYMTKPFDGEALLGEVRRLLGEN